MVVRAAARLAPKVGVGAKDERRNELAHKRIRGRLILAAEADGADGIGVNLGEAREVDTISKGGDRGRRGLSEDGTHSIEGTAAARHHYVAAELPVCLL